MCPIDIPYAYVQQVAANHPIYTQHFHREKNKAEQTPSSIKVLAGLLEYINKNVYPEALKGIEFLIDTEAAALQQQMPAAADLRRICAELEKEIATAPHNSDERDLLQSFLDFTKNNLHFVEILAFIARPLTAEELKAERRYAQKIIAQNRADTSPRIKGRENINKLFS